MPCRDYEYYDSVQRNTETVYRDNPETIEKIHKMSKLLCSVMTKLKNNHKLTHDKIVGSDKELEDWWTKHQEDDRREAERNAELDRKRRARIKLAEDAFKLREQALRKLTKAERRALKL